MRPESATKRVVEQSPPRCTTAGGFFMTRTELPLAALVAERCRELGLRRSEVAARCGYKNISKGLRRLDQVLAGEFRESGCASSRLAQGAEPVARCRSGGHRQNSSADRGRAGRPLACEFSAECVSPGNDRPAFANIVFRNYGRPGEVAEDSTRPVPTSCELCRASSRGGA